MLFTRVLTCFHPYPYIHTSIYIHIHPYTFHIHSIYIPYTFHIYSIYIYNSIYIYIYHFCCEHPISAVWIHRLTTASWGEHRLDGVEDALDQWLRVLNPWGQITWRENRAAQGSVGDKNYMVIGWNPWKLGQCPIFGRIFSRKICEHLAFFFRRWRSLNGSKRRIWAAGWKLARNYKNQFWTSQSDDISENIQIGEIYLLY